MTVPRFARDHRRSGDDQHAPLWLLIALLLALGSSTIVVITRWPDTATAVGLAVTVLASIISLFR